VTIDTTDTDHESRRRALYAALGFCQLQDSPDIPEVTALKQWLGTWTSIGHIVVGLERQGYAVSLSPIPGSGWTASFADHRLLAPAGFAIGRIRSRQSSRRRGAR
jgi:hypothetical protein